MAKFTISIDCDNAAFDDTDLWTQVARILRHLSDGLESTNPDRTSPAGGGLRDFNGNHVGNWTYEP